MRPDLADLRVADVGVEDLRQNFQLFGANQLLIIEVPPIRNDGMVPHVPNAACNLVTHNRSFYWNITQPCCCMWNT